MYVVISFGPEGKTTTPFTSRVKAFKERSRTIREEKAYYAEVVDVLLKESYGYGVSPEELLLSAILNEPLPKKKFYINRKPV